MPVRDTGSLPRRHVMLASGVIELSDEGDLMESRHPDQATTGRPTLEVRALVDRALELEADDAAGYLAAAKKAVDISKSHGTQPEVAARARIEYGNALRVNGRFAEAIEVLQGAIAAAEALTGPDRDGLVGLAHMRTAIIYDVMGESPAGLEHLRKAADGYRAAGDEAGLARCDNVMGALYLRVEDYAQAAQCFRKSLAYAEKSGDNRRLVSTLSNLSVATRFMKDYTASVAAAERAAELASTLEARATSLANLAISLHAAGRLRESEAVFLQADDFIRDLGDPAYTAEHNRAFAQLYIELGEYEKAKPLLGSALATARELGLARQEMNSRRDLYELYKAWGDPARALEHLEAFHELVRTRDREDAARDLELFKWRTEVERARLEAERERARREQLASSYAELDAVHRSLTARATELEWYSYRDSLTELANRRYFDERLTSEAERATSEGIELSLMMLDLDEFKKINDEHGHPVGDEVLRTVARLLLSSVRRSDLVARLGGEEFAILLTSTQTLGESIQLAEQIRTFIADYNWSRVHEGLAVTVSIGGAALSEAGGDPLRLLALADRRLYRAKRSGRNRATISG